MEINKVYNENYLDTMKRMPDIQFAEQLAIAKNKHPKPLDTQYKVLNLVACTKCKSAHYKGIV